MKEMKIKRFEAIPADFDQQLEAIAKVYSPNDNENYRFISAL